LEQALQVEFERKDRSWKTIYYSYELFKEHFDTPRSKDAGILKDKLWGMNPAKV
jgi:hypothetical protein